MLSERRKVNKKGQFLLSERRKNGAEYRGQTRFIFLSAAVKNFAAAVDFFRLLSYNRVEKKTEVC